MTSDGVKDAKITLIDDPATLISNLRRKLESKSEAILVLSQELEQSRSERDHFQNVCFEMQKKKGNKLDFIEDYEDSWINLLSETQKQKKHYQYKFDLINQKWNESQGDLEVLREQLQTLKQSMNMTHSKEIREKTFHEKEILIKELESSKLKCKLLEKDLESVLDEKEELITQRDAYKQKVNRLNLELNFFMKNNDSDKKFIDIDSLLMENRYLQDRLKQSLEEKSLAMQTLSKYKNILERKRNKGLSKLGNNVNGSFVVTHKQVEDLLQLDSLNEKASQGELKSLCVALLDALRDKNLALSHQKKANRILGTRVTELEKKLKDSYSPPYQSVDDNAAVGKTRTLSYNDAPSLENEFSLKKSRSHSFSTVTMTGDTLQIDILESDNLESIPAGENHMCKPSEPLDTVSKIPALKNEDDPELPVHLQKLLEKAMDDLQ